MTHGECVTHHYACDCREAALEKEIKCLKAELATAKVNAEAALDERVIEWFDSSPRKSATHAFTAGGLRNAARVVERLEAEIKELHDKLAAVTATPY
jgi:hypothetical protein